MNKSAYRLIKTTILINFIIGILGSLVCILSHKNIVSFLNGLVLGGLGAVIVIWLMARSIDNALDKKPDKAISYSLWQYFLRALITIFLLIMGILFDIISLVGIILGLLTIKIAAYLYPFLESKFKRR